MAGQRQKNTDLLINQRGGRVKELTVVIPEARRVPKCPLPVGPHARAVWRKFFRSHVSLAVDLDADWPALRRWIYCVDQVEKFVEIADARPTVFGSQGQSVLNPLYMQIERLNKERYRIQERFGMDPMSRFRLQFTATEAKRSANDLRRELLRPVDPRVVSGPSPEIIDLDVLG